MWRKAHGLTLAVYAATKGFPVDEIYGLRLQIRRSAASIGTNIAEGCGRRGDREFGRFLHFAMGSTSELDYQLLLARDLGLLPGGLHSELQTRTTEIKKMLSSLLSKLRAVGCQL